MTTLVTEIERFSIYDGPGIRTTVFLKGCPLHCAWCHNPECIDFHQEIMYEENRCNKCGCCTHVCAQEVHSVNAIFHHLKRELCKGCGTCENVCPNNALRMAGKSMTPEEVLQIVERDCKYYFNEGGLTISGGEPLANLEFTEALSRLAHQKGIHVAIETSGYASTEEIEHLLPFVDLFLWDYKETNSELHRKYTGVDNELILRNLDFVLSKGAKILLRCPIIPGYNDRIDHYQGIAKILQKHPSILGCECMAYHNIGISKYNKINKPYYVTAKPLSEKEKICILNKINTFSPITVKWG